jgi:hypothetical protein
MAKRGIIGQLCVRRGSQTANYSLFFDSLYNNISNLLVLAAQHRKLLHLENYFEDRQSMQLSLLNFDLFLPIGLYISNILPDTFEKYLGRVASGAAACCCSKELCANVRNTSKSTNRKRELHSAIFRSGQGPIHSIS